MSHLVSIIIPAYNAEKYIRAAVESVLSQTYKNYEIIVVNDGSTDNTARIVQGFGDSIRYIYQENQGLSSARNTAIRTSNGELIALLDADDLWQPDFLEKMVNHISFHSQAAAVYCGFNYIDTDDQIIGKPSIKVVPPEKFYEKIIYEGNWLAPCAVVFRKQLAEEVGLFDEEIGPVADSDLWIRLSRLYPFIGLPEALVGYRRHENNMSNDPNQMVTANYRKMIKLFGPMEGNPSQWPDQKQHAFTRVFRSGAASYLAYGDSNRSAQYFRQLLSISPEAGTSMATWRKMARAHLPQEYNRPDFKLDLTRAERNVLKMIDELGQMASETDFFQKQISKIKGFAFLALADEAGQANETNRAYIWFWRAIHAYPRLLLARPFWGTLIRIHVSGMRK